MIINGIFCSGATDNGARIIYYNQLMHLQLDGTIYTMIEGILEVPHTTENISRIILGFPLKIMISKFKGASLTEAINANIYSDSYSYNSKENKLVLDGIECEYSDYEAIISDIDTKNQIEITFANPILTNAVGSSTRRVFRIWINYLNAYRPINFFHSSVRYTFSSGRFSSNEHDKLYKTNIAPIIRWYCHLVLPPNMIATLIEPGPFQHKRPISRKSLEIYLGNDSLKHISVTKNDKLKLEAIQWNCHSGVLHNKIIPDPVVKELMFFVAFQRPSLPRYIQIISIVIAFIGLAIALITFI